MRTEIIFTNSVYHERFKEGDTGYIDGYVLGGDGRPCAVVVLDDGYIGLAPTHSMKACGLTGRK